MNKNHFLQFIEDAFELNIEYTVNKRYSDPWTVNVYMTSEGLKTYTDNASPVK